MISTVLKHNVRSRTASPQTGCGKIVSGHSHSGPLCVPMLCGLAVFCQSPRVLSECE